MLAACHLHCVAPVCLVRFLLLAHSVHARMGKRRSEDDGLDTGFRERSRPAEDQAGDRLPRDLRYGAANDQTHLLEGGDVRHGTSEPQGPAEPTDVGTTGVVGLGQPQQQRLIAGPQPYEQPRTLPRRSPSGYAWQVEVAAGKLVMAASKLMCKELGAGARCQLRKAAANQITALRYISEAVGVKSFERATTELRADLDTPALAEALKTTERKLQFAEQRVATLEASGSREQIHDAFDVMKLERVQEVMFVERPEETRRARRKRKKHTCYSNTDGEGHHCLQNYRSGCGKRCCGRLHGDNDISVGRNDHVTKRECLNSCETCEEDAARRCWIFGRQTQSLPTHPNHCLFGTSTCKSCFGRTRTRWTLCERDHQIWARAHDEGHACLGGLQMDTGKTSIEDATSERCEWLHLQNTDRWTGTVWCPYVARPTERGESKNVTKRCEVHGRQQTHPGTATVETRPLLYTMQPPEIVDMLLEWSRKAGVPWPVVLKAPDPRQRTKNGDFWFVAAEGSLP